MRQVIHCLCNHAIDIGPLPTADNMDYVKRLWYYFQMAKKPPAECPNCAKLKAELIELKAQLKLTLMSKSQRACRAVRMIKDRAVDRRPGETTRAAAARAVAVNDHYIQSAISLDNDAGELFEQVEAGKLAMKEAIARLQEKKNRLGWK
jgi:hypothetical protein